MANLAQFLDKAFEGHELKDLADAPVDALAGVSKADAELLQKAFGIKSIRDLGTNKYFLWAQAITALSGK
jgi:hypothetical protein